MITKKSTKRALLSSVLATVLCAAMLIGTTFAWFTDSVTSGKNKIVAGNLDIELYQVEGSTETPVTADTNLFREDALWEPGHVEVVTLKMANLGTLALEYALDISIANETAGTNAAGDPFRLSDYIQFAAVDGNNTYATREQAIAAAEAAGSTPISQLAAGKSGVLYPADKATAENPALEYVTLIVYMPETVGNEANYKTGTTAPTIDMGISLLATQTPYEADSFDQKYDDKAGELNFTEPGDYTVDLDETPAYGNGDYGVIQAQKDVIVNITGSGAVKAQESSDKYAMAVAAYEGGTVNIYGGTYTQEITGSDEQYDMIYAAYGGNINIYGGTFKSVTPKWTLNVRDADYQSSASKITVYGGTFYKYNPAQSDTEPGGPVSYVADGYTVIQNGDWYTVVKAAVDSAEALKDAIASANDGDTIVLTKDIELTTSARTIDKNITFDAQGNTISGVPMYIGSTNNVTVKNAVFDNAKGTKESCVYVNNTSGINVFENCVFENTNWDVIQMTGNIEGAQLVVNNCTFANAAQRYIHVEALENGSPDYNTNVKVTITNNTFGQNPAGNDAIGLYYIADAGITAYNNTFASEEPTIYICSSSIHPSISQADAIAMFTAKK